MTGLDMSRREYPVQRTHTDRWADIDYARVGPHRERMVYTVRGDCVLIRFPGGSAVTPQALLALGITVELPPVLRRDFEEPNDTELLIAEKAMRAEIAGRPVRPPRPPYREDALPSIRVIRAAGAKSAKRSRDAEPSTPRPANPAFPLSHLDVLDGAE